MPQLALAAASFTASAAPAIAATAAKATLMTTLKSVAMNVLTNVAISAAMSVLQPQVGAAGRPFEFVIDPDGPIPFAAGRIGVAGSVIHRDTFGPDLMFYGIPAVLSGAGPITAIESVKADDHLMAFDANGGATTEPYRQEFYFRSVLGEQPAPLALSTPAGLKNGAKLPGWGPSHKLSGKAAFLMVMAENSKGSAFPTGEVKPLVTLRGLKVYDPRQDSTYPGGVGPQRLSDPSTWTYSANPILWALKWCLGLWEGPNGKGAPQVDFQVGGIGAKPSGIDFPAFVAAANVSDANDWTVAAYPNTDDDKSQVLDGFLQAGGCVYAQRAGKISCIQRAAPRASVVTISAADTAGPLEIDTAASRIDRINTLRPRFWSEAHRWQMTALDGEITAQAYRDEDGAARTRGLDFPFVSNARQCGQLAALQIANTREGIAGVIPLKPHMQRVRPGDAFTITEPGFVLNGVKCLCLNTDYDPATGVVRVSFVSETDAKYPFAMGQNPTPPAPQVLTPVDPGFVSPPEAGDWTIIVRPPSPGGGQLPGFELGGIVSNDTATAIIVEHGPAAEGPWTQAYQGPPTVTKIPIDGLQPGGTYYVAIQYQRNQNYSTRQVYGPYTAPLLDPSPTAPTITALNAEIAALEALQASETVIREEQYEGVAARLNASGQNLLKNPAALRGVENWTNGDNVISVTEQPSGMMFARFFGPGGSGDAYSFFYQDIPFDGPGQPVSWQSKLYVDGPVTALSYARALNASGVDVNPAGPSVWQIETTTSPADNYITASGVAPAGTKIIRVLWATKATGPGYVLFTRQKMEASTTPSAWTDEATTRELSASVSEHSLALIDLETGAALAKFELVAAASGGRPARLRLVSSSLVGSAIALDAEYLYLGPNTVWDTTTNTEQTTVGSRIRVTAKGLPFGTAGNLLEWWGPTGIALTEMTTGNGYNGRMTSAPYVFDNTATVGVSALRSTIGSNAGAFTTETFATIAAAGFTSLPTGGTLRLYASALPTSGMTLTGAGVGTSLTGEVRVLQNGVTVATGTMTAYVTGGDADAQIFLNNMTPVVPAQTGLTSLQLQWRSATSGRNIGGTGAQISFYADWTKNG